MKEQNLGRLYLHELETEVPASRKCLERIPPELFGWKPHEKSTLLGDLALLVAEIPLWITHTIEISEIDFATFKHFEPKTTAELVKHFDENVAGAKQVLENASDETLSDNFYLKRKGQVLFTMRKHENVAQSINHMVHHRGQLTVYMRLNDIPVPSIYGPSADEKVF